MSSLGNFVWSIADQLRGVYKPHQYVMDQMGADQTLTAQADANTTKQFLESPDLSDAVTGAVLSNQDNDNRIAELFFANPRAQVEMVRLLGRLFHQTVRVQAG